jgi:predicted amidohydrolase
MTREVRVAAVQLASGPEPEENVERATVLVRRAANEGASYIQLPEYFNYRGPTSRYPSVAESIPGATTVRFAALARELGITLHVGSLFERAPALEKSFNTSVVIAPSGDIVATYRKVHLFDVNVPGGIEHQESKNIAPGDRLVVTDVEGFSLGMSVCFDVRFPELYRSLCLKGATVLAVPSSFAVATGRVHWATLLRARAIENEAYVIAAAQAGTTSEGVSSYGHSMIIDPWGEVLGESSIDGEDVLHAVIDLDEVARRRAQIAVFELRRPDVYNFEPTPASGREPRSL